MGTDHDGPASGDEEGAHEGGGRGTHADVAAEALKQAREAEHDRYEEENQGEGNGSEGTLATTLDGVIALACAEASIAVVIVVGAGDCRRSGQG